jgi:hypothetical protein
MATSLLVSSSASAPSYTAGLSNVMARLGYMACLAAVEVESLVILPLAFLKVDLRNVEVHAIYIYYVNIRRCATLVAVIIVVAFA